VGVCARKGDRDVLGAISACSASTLRGGHLDWQLRLDLVLGLLAVQHCESGVDGALIRMDADAKG
jgi:hypothetical protein